MEPTTAYTTSSDATDQLLKNLASQLDRLVEQLSDIEEMKTELTTDEYDRMKLDTVDQIGEFTETLNRMQSGDVTLDSKFTMLRKSIRQAISAAYKTTEIRQAFGTGSALAVDGEAAENEKRMVLEKLFGQMEQVDDDDEEEGQFT